MKIVLKISIFIVLMSISTNVLAQRLSIRSNVLGLMTLSPNLGFDVILSRRISIGLNASANLTTSDSWRARHMSISPEVRYWLVRPTTKHFITANLLAITYDLKLSGDPYKGDMLAFGLGYGYALPLGKHWNLEPQIAVGYGIRRDYAVGGSMYQNARYFSGPMITKIGLSFSYIIK